MTIEEEEKKIWEEKYISQKQLTSILTDEPFKLSHENAYELSRYIVEDEYLFEKSDPNNPFVYEDETNQI